ncbi:ABC transporter ATP-binding protein [Streptococcus pseudoporcinus]|uniref:ABC transporter, ATP-binding protein n=1 Tax=Streptococcus pseudoporcinus LQ 940-04 TaxID=875093 RepID=G5KBL8_9STRE|nr:ABC transporter ATP-binding protein [Streptococcus pseudoporcinus]EFR45357.1 ABC transporter, ATP-binding protein [Streptococcus pseudoporcinus SPIN 20026]EHI64277.1 ABC transporter, ATP-binding protein [Streptococcus pseudoporcinus LQ 940-04]VEF92873.1 lipid A export ATP-binding/permease msbA [Streptococcus pseudoporcinus]
MATLKRLFYYANEKKMYLIFSLLFSAIATILSFIPYYYFWEILKEMTGNADKQHIQKFALLTFGATILYLLTYLASLLCSHIFAFRLESNMRKVGLKHLLDASFSFFDLNSSGRTRKIIDDNASNTHTIIAHILPDSINAILFPICLVVLSFRANSYVGLLVVVAIGFSLICLKSMYSDADMMKEYMGALEDINSETVEYVRGIQVIKIFDMMVESFEKLHKSIINYSLMINKQCQMFKIPYVLFQCGMMSFGALIIIIAFAQLQMSKTMGQVLSLVVFFMTFSGLLYNAFIKMMFFSKDYSVAKDAIDKLETLFTEMDSNKLDYGNVTDLETNDIEFSEVSFEYETGRPILKNFSLKLKANHKYALVGSSGSGKSTIAKLISGFYPITSGQLKIGGHDIKDYKSRVIEKNIAFVFQQAKLFKTSIFENVKLGNPDSSDEEVMKALKLAMCESILDKFEAREQTIIGAKGVHLSGGEVQRIAIARAILKDAPIIILDEASAASDPENEYAIQKAFSSLMANKTVIMIAHRLTSIRNVDEILVIEDGRLIERGSHETLIKQGGKYKQFQDLYAQANDWRL